MPDIQIPIGGDIVNVPEWAKESTLQSLLSVIRSNDQARNLVIKAMNITADDINSLEKATDDLKKVERESSYNQAQTIGDTVRSFSQRAVGVLEQLGDTSKPLSNMTNMAKQFKDTISGSDQRNAKTAKMVEKFNFVAEGWGEKLVAGTGIATDAILAYGGFLAAKIEQFAEAQGNMIDSGAIFFENAQTFQHIREVSQQSGVGYQMMAKTINKYGRAVQSLGDGVSGGSVVFAESFNRLNDANNAYGDFGQTNSEMLETYAEYVDVMRLTGQSQQLLANNGEGLTMGYQQLMLENSSLAAATAFNRKQILATSFEALSDVDFAAPNRRIREKMGPEIADNLQAMQKTLGLLGSVDPSKGGLGKVGQMFQKVLISAQTNFARGGAFNLDGLTTDQIQFMSAIKNMDGGTEFVEQLEKDILNPQMKLTMAEISQRIMQLKEKDGAFTVADQGMTVVMKDVSNAVSSMKNANQKLADMSEEDLNKLRGKTGEQLEAQGAVTEAVNSAAAMLLRAQEMLTPNMVKMSDVIKNIADGYSSKNLLVTETEKRKALESKIGSTGDAFTKNKQAYDDGVELAGLAMSGSRQALQKLIEEYVDNGGDVEDLSLPSGFVYKQRFIGGYLGSGENTLVGEEGPEMYVTDMPGYVKTMNQIGRNLGDAIKSSMSEDGIRTEHFSGGFKKVSSGTGTDLFDKDGNLLYNDSPKIGGYQRRVYAEGDIAEIYELRNLGANQIIHMFNGKRIGVEVQSGGARVVAIGNTGEMASESMGINQSGNSFIGSIFDMGGGLEIGAASKRIDGVSSGTAYADYNDPINGRIFNQGNFDVNGDSMDPQSEEFKGQMLEAARALKLSLKNLVEQKKKNNVRASAEYE